MIGIGIMSGSSLDGLDIVAVEFIEDKELSWKILAHATMALKESIADRLSRILKLSTQSVFELQSDYTLYIGQVTSTFLQSNKLNPSYASVHGHTVMHSPEYKSSWQLLNGGLLATTIDCPVVCDFRNQDMGLGGQGTPMAVIVDRDLYPGYDYYINLGGIANISYQKDNRWIAYDLFPFNQVLNYYAKKLGKPYDKDGSIAAQGIVNQKLLQQLHSEPYITSLHPKSIDNSWVMDYWIEKIDAYNLSVADTMRTYIEFAVHHISTIIPADSKILWTGGGVHNKFFMRTTDSNGLYSQIPDSSIIDYKEAVLIAYAAYLRLHEKINFISSATGAERDVVGGGVYLA